MADFVTQHECEQRRAGIAKDFDELEKRVHNDELELTKTKTQFKEQLKTLFNIVKFLSGIASAVLVAEIINFIGRVI